MSRPAPRGSDERTLEWVKLRCSGVSPTEISARFDTSKDYIRAATGRIKTADIAASDENITEHYWQ